jgi:hypothetical protein
MLSKYQIVLQAILEDEVKETKSAHDTLSNFQKVNFKTNCIYLGPVVQRSVSLVLG